MANANSINATSRRACLECAKARDRCTRNYPCLRCSSRRLQCVYPTLSGLAHAQELSASPSQAGQVSLFRPICEDSERVSGQGVLSDITPPQETITNETMCNSQDPFRVYSYSNEPLPTFDLPESQSLQSAMDFSLNWLPMDNSIAIDYENILGLDISSMNLFPSLSTPLSDLGSQPAPPTGNNVAISNSITGFLTEGNQASRLYGPSHANPSDGSPEDSSMPSSLTSPNSSILHESLDARQAGLYATSLNGARQPCTIRVKRPRDLLEGGTPIKTLASMALKHDQSWQLCFPDTSRVSTDSPEVSHVIKPNTTPMLTTTMYATLKNKFAQLCLQDNICFPKFTSKNFPSYDAFNLFTELYFQNFNAIIPMLHEGVAKLNDHWQLALGVSAIGCQYAEANEYSACVEPIHEMLRRARAIDVGQSESYRVIRSSSDIANIQASILNHIGMLYCGSSRLHRFARAEHGALVDWAQCSGLLQSPRTSNGDSGLDDAEVLEGFAPKQLLFVECKRRIGYTIWVITLTVPFSFVFC